MNIVFLVALLVICTHDGGQGAVLGRLPLAVLFQSKSSQGSATWELPKIVGGQVAEPNEFPFLVSLQEKSFFGFSHSCGGSVVDRRFILEAAHCVQGVSASNLLVVAGEHSLSEESGFEQARKVRSIAVHPQYNAHTSHNDIAVLELWSPLDFSTGRVAPIALDIHDVQAGSIVTVSGWGSLFSGSGRTPDLLRKVQLPIVSNEQCAATYGRDVITHSMLCAGFDQGGKDTCQGDSGGPLFRSDPFRLVGIVSWGQGCAVAGYPGVYTRVADFIDFVQSVVVAKSN